MSKKDNVQVMDETMDVDVAVAEPTDEAAKLEAFKAKKREAANRFKENKKKQQEARVAGAKAFIDELKAANLYDKISDNAKTFLNGLINPVQNTGNNQSLFRTLFGDNPQVGASFTLATAFEKTLKGKSNLDHYTKKWAEKGIIVTFKQDADNILNSTYVLEQLSGTADVAE